MSKNNNITEQTFKEYLIQARWDFAKVVEKHRLDVDLELRKAIHSFFIAYNYAAFRLENYMCWTLVEDKLPDELETVWISNGKGWTTLGCRVPDENGWHWAQSNGVIYQQDNKIMSECESDDLDVRFWQRLPEPPLFGYLNKY